MIMDTSKWFEPEGDKIVELMGLLDHGESISYQYIDLEKRASGNFQLDRFKLVLYPLSALTRPITHNGETFVPLSEIALMVSDGETSNFKLRDNSWVHVIWVDENGYEQSTSLPSIYDLEFWPYECVQKLIEWRFVFDEPEGTWISVDELDTKPYN